MKHKFDDEGYCRFRLSGFVIELIDDTMGVKCIESPKLVGLVSEGATHATPNHVFHRGTIQAVAHFCGEAAPRIIEIPVRGGYWLGNPVGANRLRGHYCP